MVDAPGVQYVPIADELEVLPRVRVVPTPGHTPGSQVVVVESGGRPVVIYGDTAVFHSKLGEPRTVKAIWKPNLSTQVDEENAQSSLKMMAALEDDDDVQNVYANF